MPFASNKHTTPIRSNEGKYQTDINSVHGANALLSLQGSSRYTVAHQMLQTSDRRIKYFFKILSRKYHRSPTALAA
jgi:hypothetical protein